jgi:hypothetical protein
LAPLSALGVSGEPTFTYSLKILRQHQIARCGILGEIALPRLCAAGDCARTATLSVHVAIAAAIVRILRDIRFCLPRPRKRFSIPCACVLRGRHLTSSQDIVRIVDQQRHSRVLNTCPSVSMDGMQLAAQVNVNSSMSRRDRGSRHNPGSCRRHD